MGMISRLPGCAGQAADTVSSYPGRKGSCTTTDKKSEVRMSRYLDASTTTQMDKIVVQHGRSSRSSWTKSARSSFTRTIMGKTIRESSIRTRLGKSSTLRMLIRKLRKRTILVCVCGRYKTVWKETEHRPNVKNTHEIFLDHVYLGCTQREFRQAKIL